MKCLLRPDILSSTISHFLSLFDSLIDLSYISMNQGSENCKEQNNYLVEFHNFCTFMQKNFQNNMFFRPIEAPWGLRVCKLGENSTLKMLIWPQMTVGYKNSVWHLRLTQPRFNSPVWNWRHNFAMKVLHCKKGMRQRREWALRPILTPNPRTNKQGMRQKGFLLKPLCGHAGWI